jgi:3-oxoacyl-[acyl-carrier protein] reductase
MDISLTKRHALVCGSSRGIGRAIAMELAACGAAVTVVARTRPALEEVLRKLPRDNHQPHELIVADFSNPEQLEERVLGLVARRPVQILVNNTGGPPVGFAHTADSREYQEAFTRHLICSQVLTGAVLAGMRKAGYGRIINLISTSVKQPIEGLGVSNTVRGAVASWAKTLASELGPDKITVNNVLPGSTDTDRLAAIIRSRAVAAEQSEQKIIEAMQRRIPLGRFAQPSEIANAVAFLASPAADYINGINLPVDGGMIQSL